jgi:KDO2-lipid IV(A) lauroyltransferase
MDGAKKIPYSFFAPVKYLVSYLSVRLLAAFIRFLPFKIISRISNGGAFLAHRILRYRRKTVLLNLTRCFPEQTPRDLKRLLPRLYLNLTDVFLETIKAFSLSPEDIMRNVHTPKVEELDLYQRNYRGAILVTAHLANWEWCGYCLDAVLPTPGIAVYRPLKNSRVDIMMRKHREKSRMKLVPMREIVKILAKGAAESHFVLLIADQSPDPDGAHWENFFGIKTAFFKGPSTLAHRYNLPVFFVSLERIGRHQYQMHLEPLCLNPKAHAVQDITRMYVQSLEAHIQSQPEAWLWTHRRWKHESPADT